MITTDALLTAGLIFVLRVLNSGLGTVRLILLARQRRLLTVVFGFFEALLGADAAVVRTMPNTPAAVHRGITVACANARVAPAQRTLCQSLLEAVGQVAWVEDEALLDPVTAVSGSGPAYVFLVMEALIDAAVHLGFPRHIAHDIVIETLEGSTRFAKQSGDHPAVLRNMVTSPAGTSAAAIHELESGRLRTVLSEAVWAAFRRTVELGDQMDAQLTGDRAPTR